MFHKLTKGPFVRNESFRLAIIENTKDKQMEQPLVRGRPRCRIPVLDASTLKGILSHHFAAENINVVSFSSPNQSGVGKTHLITARFNAERLKYVRVAINSQPTSDELVLNLTKANTRLDWSNAPSHFLGPAWHFNLGGNVMPQFNLQLFQLLVVGCLITSDGNIFWRPSSARGPASAAAAAPGAAPAGIISSPKISFFIEIPTTLKTIDLFFFTKHIHLEKILPANNPLDVSRANERFLELYQIDGNNIIQNRVQYVCKYLQYLFYSRERVGYEMFNPHHKKDIPADEYALVNVNQAYFY